MSKANALNQLPVSILLTTTPLSSTSSVVFNSFISSLYSYYVITVRSLIADTSNAILQMTWSTDNGATYIASGYKWAQPYNNSAGGSGLNSSGNDTTLRIQDALNNDAAQPVNFDMQLFNLGSSTICPSFHGSGVVHDSGTQIGVINSGGGLPSTNNINAIKIFPSTGAMTSGTISLYGIIEA